MREATTLRRPKAPRRLRTFEAEVRQLCYHEAAHAVLCWHFQLPIVEVIVYGKGKRLRGHVAVRAVPERALPRHRMHMAVVYLAGIVGESLLPWDVYRTTPFSDISSTLEIAVLSCCPRSGLFAFLDARLAEARALLARPAYHRAVELIAEDLASQRWLDGYTVAARCELARRTAEPAEEGA
jgi:hypothetical protein